MEMTRPSPLAKATDVSAAQLAKAALRRLAVERLEPTPENYERAWRHEAGDGGSTPTLAPRGQKIVERLAARAFESDSTGLAADIAQAVGSGRWEVAERALDVASQGGTEGLAALIERIVRGIDRGGRNWTPARRKEGLQRVLAGGRADAKRLQQRLSQLVASWEGDTIATEVEVAEAPVASSPEVVAAAAVDAKAPAAGSRD